MSEEDLNKALQQISDTRKSIDLTMYEIQQVDMKTPEKTSSRVDELVNHILREIISELIIDRKWMAFDQELNLCFREQTESEECFQGIMSS